MKKMFGCTLTAITVLAGTGWAGSLDSPAPPSDGVSAMPTINEVYNRLTSGSPGTARSGPFRESGTGPGPSSHTLSEVLLAAPVADASNGATPDEVKAGKTYWGLRTDNRWGLHVGTNTAWEQRTDSRWGLQPAPVAQTGQTTCANTATAGQGIDCPGTGQDGELQPGAAWPTPRFIDNHDGTVTDTLTGLVWLRNSSCTGELVWADALSWSNNLANGQCGLSDGSRAGEWRLPQAFEMESLLALQYANPALANTAGTGQWTSGDPFLDVHSASYWTSTTTVSSPRSALAVYLYDGAVYSDPKTISLFVWPVRGGQ